MDRILDYLTIDDLPNDALREVAQLCGIEVARELIAKLPGRTICVPKNGNRTIIRNVIAGEWDGTNSQQLMDACRISRRTFYRILNSKCRKIVHV